MDDRVADDSGDENESRAHSGKIQRIKKNEMKKFKDEVCDSDSCECHCQGKHVRGGSKKKAVGGGSKNSKGKSKKTATIPCSSSEACEYDKEQGEDDEEEGEFTQREHPELSSLFNDLCHTKYSNYNSIENSSKFSGFVRNRKIQKGNQRSAEGSQNSGQTASFSVEASSQGQTTSQTSQTCDFMSGLHYAIPFLSDRLKSSLLNRLRCQSEPRDSAEVTNSWNTLEAEDCGINGLDDLSETGNSSENETSTSHNQQLPHCHHDNQNRQIPLACQQTIDNPPFCQNENRSYSQHLDKKLPCPLKEYESTPSEVSNSFDIPSQSNFNHCSMNGESVEHDDIEEKDMSSCEDHGFYHEDWRTVNDRDEERYYNGCPSYYDDEDWCRRTDTTGNRGAGQEEESIMGTAMSQEEEIESAVKHIAKDVGKIDFLESVLERGEESDGQISSEDSSEMVPHLFSSLSSDSCQADDEFECDCGHCVGSMPGDNDNVLDLDWQTADGLEGSAREESSSPSVMPVGLMLPPGPDEGEPEEGVYRFTLLSPFDADELEVMFETMVANLQDINLVGGDEQAPPPASTSTIESLPYSTVTAQQIDDLAPCSICLSSFVVMDTSSHLPCNHLFHHHCIKAWLTKSASCPVCRSRVKSPTDTIETEHA